MSADRNRQYFLGGGAGAGHTSPQEKGISPIPSSTRELPVASPESVPWKSALGSMRIAKEKNRTVKGACRGGE